MSIDHLDNLFHPRSIAVVGASERHGSVGWSVMVNLMDAGFEGPLYPVNDRNLSIMGKKSFAALNQIGEPVDLVIVATPMNTVPPIIAGCSRIGAAGAVIISAGGKETGHIGRQVEARIREEAAVSGLRIIGPNCLGVMCSGSHLNASFASRMCLEGKLAFISQSGAICTAILDFSVKERIGFSHFISLGSMLDVDFGDVIDYLGADPKVDSIVMYVESLSNHRHFMSAARAVSRVKPIIALKAGRSRAGASAVAAHTGNMAGEEAVYDAAFERAGIVRVKTFEELFDSAEILSRKVRYQGTGVAILTNAGGPGVMAADALSDYGVEPAELSRETMHALDARLPAHWSHGNPVDILGDATPERYAAAVSILRRAKEVRALLVMLAPQAHTDATAVARSLSHQLSDTAKPIIASWMGGADVDPGREILNQAGIATFDTPERCVRAFMNLHRHARGIDILQQIPPRLSTRIQVDREDARRQIDRHAKTCKTLLTKPEAKSLLAAYGIPVNPSLESGSSEETFARRDRIEYPMATKIHSRDISHKNDVDGMRGGPHNREAMGNGFSDRVDNACTTFPRATPDGVVVQPTSGKPNVELILGARTDPDFGPVMFFGTGGVLAEVLDDQAIALPPLNRLLASRLMAVTRINRLLKNDRNHSPVNREQLEEILIRLAQLVTDFPQVAEVDINPMVINRGRPVAVDARIVLTPSSCPAPLHLAVSPYPMQYESRVQLSDVGKLLIRPIRPEDAPLLLDLFDTLSPQSVYYRFFSPMKQLSHAMLARFTQIDYDREIALVAVQESKDAEKMLGAARVILQHNLKDAEFAVLVGDPWHGKGIGAHLLTTCLDIARERGFRSIWGTVLAENKGMLALGKKLGFTIKRSESAGEFDLNLKIPMPPSPS